MRKLFTALLLLLAVATQAQEYKIYQFPNNAIPTIDGDSHDWDCVPASYAITESALKEDEGKHKAPNAETLACSVKVGWNAQTQKLYFLYEATDNYWRFSENSLNTDIFEVVVDGDCSGGPFIDRFHPTAPKDVWQAWFKFHGCHAQNYHIYTPKHQDNDWCMLWGPQVWLKQKPYSDYAYKYDFKEGEAGKLTLEFYITPYDHADADGPQFSRPTLLEEGNDIGLCWAVIDWDANPTSKDGFWNLSKEHTMYGNADYLPKFKLMPLANNGVYNVKSYGAKGDGKHIDSHAINLAIEAAAAHGGGTIYFPAGDYASYSIRLASHVHLYLEQGAKITAAFPTDKEGYDLAEPNDLAANQPNRFQDFGHSHWKNSLIWGIGLEDITISGPGMIHGKGLTREESRLPGVGNKAISLKECKNVTLKDISMLMCGHFALLATGVDNLTINNVKVDTNRDGFDIDCCKNVRISDCSVNSPWDDAIVLKASYGLGYFKDTENVTITGCFVSGYDRGSLMDCTWQRDEPQAPDHGFVTGRIKLGTESSGGFKNIAISNCIFERCRGLALETVDGGHLEDVVISNITMRDIVNAPIFLRLGARMRSPEGTPVGSMKRILISNVNVFNADSRFSNIISGIPGAKIEDVTLSNIHIYHQGGYTAEDGKVTPPEQEKVYPEPWMFGTIPAKGFYVRHARNITFDNVNFHYEKPDGRELYVTDDVEGLKIKE